MRMMDGIRFMGILERRNRCQHFGLGIEDMLVAHHACGGIANC
jgi:hypothetical protein